MSGQTIFGKAYLRTLPDGTTERVEFVGWQPVPVGITRHGEFAGVGIRMLVRTPDGQEVILDDYEFFEMERVEEWTASESAAARREPNWPWVNRS